MRAVHELILALLFSIIAWTLVNFLLIEIPLWKFFIIELLFVISEIIYTFVVIKVLGPETKLKEPES